MHCKEKHGLLTKCEVKMADIGQVLFFCMFMDQDKVEVHKLAKKEQGQISSHLDQTSLVNKRFIIWLSGKFSCGMQQVVPSGQDIFLAPVANHSMQFWFMLPAQGASHIIIKNYSLKSR